MVTKIIVRSILLGCTIALFAVAGTAAEPIKAQPAVPATPAKPAVPATPAKPATPAIPAKSAARKKSKKKAAALPTILLTSIPPAESNSRRFRV